MYSDWRDAVEFYKEFRPRDDDTMLEKTVDDIEGDGYPSLSYESPPTKMMMDETWVQI